MHWCKLWVHYMEAGRVVGFLQRRICRLLYTPYISRGFYFHEFRESGSIREFNNTQKYLPPIRPDAWMRLVYAILVVQYTVHVQGRMISLILPSENEWAILRSPSIVLLDHKFNHSRKCREVPIREILDSRNIWRMQYDAKASYHEG